MKRFAFLILIGLVFSYARGVEPQTQPTDPASPNAEDEAGETTMSVWMEKKLLHSQAILRGLAMGDFQDVQYNASRLKVLNRVEGFVRRNPDYRSHLNTFSRASAEIERQAEKKNIEGATLAFNQLTVSCVQCHQSLRISALQSDQAPPDSVPVDQ